MPAAKLSRRRLAVSPLRITGHTVSAPVETEPEETVWMVLGLPESCECGGTGLIPLPDHIRMRAEVDFVNCPRHHRGQLEITIKPRPHSGEPFTGKIVSSSAVCLP
ncbi:hypothetical protein ACIRPK_04325 [Kitasatospora sp. NPDC101801]|uniref:hypothetical protein n=1 Tax=Kitasatospora sp. NPDC101801 TaxID=3364103 RepID=UPI0037FDE80C